MSGKPGKTDVYRFVIKTLLRILNSRWLNHSPCSYEFVGNIDAFSTSFLESSVEMKPDVTVREILEDAARSKTCPVGRGLQVEENGEFRDATIWDVHQLRQDLTRDEK